ncbi:MAG: siroheme synthase [Alphaproteobacteria bacterium]|nr:siroheme synthase [Alphaproteobacteria bacterium]
MIPVMLDPARLRIGLIGRGDLALKRLAWFRSLDAEPEVFTDAPDGGLAAGAGGNIHTQLPPAEELAQFDLLWIADLDAKAAASLAGAARRAKVLVNVEDDLAHCDFHTPAVVRRGRLVLAAGTGGASPAVAAAVRARLEVEFPVRWADVLEDIAAARTRLRDAGAAPSEVAADARARLAAAKLI